MNKKILIISLLASGISFSDPFINQGNDNIGHDDTTIIGNNSKIECNSGWDSENAQIIGNGSTFRDRCRFGTIVGHKNDIQAHKGNIIGNENKTHDGGSLEDSSILGNDNSIGGFLNETNIIGNHNKILGFQEGSNIIGYQHRIQGGGERNSVLGYSSSIGKNVRRSGVFGIGGIGDDSDGSFTMGIASVGKDSSGSFSIGYFSRVGNNSEFSYSMGADSRVGNNSNFSYAIGGDAKIGDNVNRSYAIGYKTKVNSDDTVAFGNNINADIKNSVYLGANSTSATNNNSKVLEKYESDNLFNLGTVNFNGGSTNGVLTVGAEGNERRVQNVAAGWISPTSTDAINGSQLYSVAKAQNEVLSAGVASSIAHASIPQVASNKLISIGFGTGYYNKQSGFALGVSGTDKKNRIVYKISAGLDTRKQFSIGAGININFGDTSKNIAKYTPDMPIDINTLKLKEKVNKIETTVNNNTDLITTLKDRINELENKLNQLLENNFKEVLYIIDQFENDSYNLSDKQLIKLKYIVKEINEKYSDRTIDVTGHTDINHNEQYNLDLGLQRAERVVNIMIALGLKNPKNIRKISSYGYNNKISNSLSTNRRVEIVIK